MDLASTFVQRRAGLRRRCVNSDWLTNQTSKSLTRLAVFLLAC